jgi:hypothetical protein
MYIISFLSLLDRVGHPRFISLPSFSRDSLENMFFRDEVAGLVLKPRFLGGPRFFYRVVSLSWFVPNIALGTRVSPLHDLAVFQRFQGSWRGHACIGLGRNRWHFPDFYWYTSTSKMCTSGTTYCPFDPLSHALTFLIWSPYLVHCKQYYGLQESYCMGILHLNWKLLL